MSWKKRWNEIDEREEKRGGCREPLKGKRSRVGKLGSLGTSIQKEQQLKVLKEEDDEMRWIFSRTTDESE